MKKLDPIEYLLSGTLLLFVLLINLLAVNKFFASIEQAILMGVFLLLESAFVMRYQLQPEKAKRCPTYRLKVWIRYFYSVFLLLTVCSVLAFALNALKTLEMMIALQWIFWILATMLVLIGAKMGLCIMGSAADDDDAAPTASTIYGKSGYSKK
ncbi:hypothetical protein SAMN05660964_03283 [Thiothrix caldifontis]|uniref:Uncharacterized protein n=1 Tax=Thiothrix caldifontis TaxID=525918 RepID=A0A1H4G5B5_9GAMM|nr:hypothetical protein [Thiothrix caldifontis]SEB04813.1 hypothetical protein SAMN05660964_03283 [Thiothrix caldifontis]